MKTIPKQSKMILNRSIINQILQQAKVVSNPTIKNEKEIEIESLNLFTRALFLMWMNRESKGLKLIKSSKNPF